MTIFRFRRRNYGRSVSRRRSRIFSTLPPGRQYKSDHIYRTSSRDDLGSSPASYVCFEQNVRWRSFPNGLAAEWMPHGHPKGGEPAAHWPHFIRQDPVLAPSRRRQIGKWEDDCCGDSFTSIVAGLRIKGRTPRDSSSNMEGRPRLQPESGAYFSRDGCITRFSEVAKTSWGQTGQSHRRSDSQIGLMDL